MIAETRVILRRGEDDLPLCREAAQKAAAAAGFEGQVLGDIVCAVFEACVNAVTHGRSGQAATLRIRVYEDRLEAVVKDSGRGLDTPPGGPLPPPTVPHGRGIPLMRAFMDEVKLDDSNGLQVTLVKYRT